MLMDLHVEVLDGYARGCRRTPLVSLPHGLLARARTVPGGLRLVTYYPNATNLRAHLRGAALLLRLARNRTSGRRERRADKLSDRSDSTNFALTEFSEVRCGVEFSDVGLPTRKKSRKKVKNGRTATPNSSGIHRVLVLMGACTRIHALRKRQTRREAGAQSIRAS